MVNAKEFQFKKFDWGRLDNWRIYKLLEPPSYDLGAIRAPIALWHGTDDRLADPKDVEWLLS
jgi:hypothetical protein